MSTDLDPFGQPFEHPEPGLDTIGRFIATTHSLLGHGKTAALIGVMPGDRDECLICIYEKNPSPERKRAVIRALAPRRNREA